MITVAFTVSCMRQKYLRAAIDSWASARGSEHARFVFCLEPTPTSFSLAEFTQYVEHRFPGRALVYRNTRKLGCPANTRQAIGVATALSEEGFGAVAEEDLEVADDTLEYLAWARDCYREDPQVVVVCAHARSSRVADPAAVVRASWFNPLVWATWKPEWDGFLSREWGTLPGNDLAWDANMQQRVRDAGKLAVFPARSRVVHRGETSTLTPLPLSEYYFRHFMSDCYAPHYPPQRYHEIAFPDAPGALVV